MKKGFCVLLALTVLFCSCSVAEEDDSNVLPSVTGYDFSFRIRLERETLSAARKANLEGYADLLEALHFSGSCYYYAPERAMELRLRIEPTDSSAEPLALRFYGYPDRILVTSNLLGEESVLIASASLLEFSVKTYEHLGLDLRYIALLWPFVYEYAAQKLVARWEKYIHPTGSNQTVKASRIKGFANALSKQLSENEDLKMLLTAIGIGTGMEEQVRSIAAEIPSYITNVLTKNRNITIRIKDGTETWSGAAGTIYTRTVSQNGESVLLNLPEMASGTRILFSSSSDLLSDGRQIDFNASLLHPESELLNILFLGARLPQAWPEASSSEMQLILSGSLVPNLSLNAFFESKENGDFSAEIRIPSSASGEGEMIMTADGSVTPRTFEVYRYSREFMYQHTDILRLNDATMASFLSRVRSSAVRGLLGFLAGIPASACQSILDDLTDSGILEMLLPAS